MLPRGSGFRPGILYPLLAVLGLLPVLPMLLKGSPVLNNDMLVAYFCYFWDFHRNWSWDHPLVFWSSSYQTGMPMHAYWQTGFLYPITWILFGPISPHVGIHLFYAFHFALAIFGFLALGPRLGLRKPAALWAGIAFGLGGTMLARYEHVTFLAGWAWMPLVLFGFLALRDRPSPGSLLAYAFSVALQALGGHPQASATTAVLIGIFTVAALFRRRSAREARPGSAAPEASGAATGLTATTPGAARPAPRSGPPAQAATPGNLPATPRRAPLAWVAAGHLLALLYCAPLVVPFLGLLERTIRFDGAAWEGKAQEGSAGEKLEEGVFGFEKFSTGGMRPLHLASLAAAHALGTPSNASWWGGEAWGEVFLYMGVLGLFFACFASPGRAGPDLRLLWGVGLLGLWFSFGAHLGASQILYHVPVFNNFRRPARFLILAAFALAALSGHGFQRWAGKPRGSRAPLVLGGAGLLGALLFLALRLLPEAQHGLLDAVQVFKKLDPAKDHAGKIAALAGRLAMDFGLTALSGAALFLFVRAFARPRARAPRETHPGSAIPAPSPEARPGRLRPAYLALFAVLVLDLARLHWDHFYLFPSSYYRTPPVTSASLDHPTRPFWRVSHYLEYPDLEMWSMHNDPLASMPLFEREKESLSYGIHAVFGYRHVSAHLPLVWKWEEGTGTAARSGRYLFSNRDIPAYHGDSLRPLGRHGEVRLYEMKDWKPRLERLSPSREDNPGPGTPENPAPKVGTSPGRDTLASPALAAAAPGDTPCDPGFQGFRGLCVQEVRDGRVLVRASRASFAPGDTVLFREHAYPGWLYRLDQGPWQRALETPEHFLAAPLPDRALQVEFAFVPLDFYQWAGIGAVVTGLIAIFAVFRRRPRPG